MKKVRDNYLGGEVFEDGSQVDRSSGTNTCGVFAVLQKPGDTTDGELETGFAAPRGRFLSDARSKSFSTTCHFCDSEWKNSKREEGKLRGKRIVGKLYS